MAAAPTPTPTGSSPEAVAMAKAFFEKPLTTTTPEQIIAQRALDKTKEDWRQGLETIKGGPVEGGERKIDEIGIERNETTGEKKREANSDEEKRHQNAEVALKRANTFLEKGYDSPELTPADKKAIKETLKRVVMSSPALQAEALAFTGGGLDAFIEEKLKTDERFRQLVRSHLEAQIQAPPLADAVTSTQAEFKRLTDRKESITNDLDRSKKERDGVDKELLNFDRSTGTKGKRLEELEVKEVEIEEGIREKEGALIVAEERYQQLERLEVAAQTGTPLNDEQKEKLETLRKKTIPGLKSEKAALEKDQRELGRLRREEKRLKTRKEELADKIDKQQEKLAEIQKEWAIANAALGDARAVRNREEDRLVKGFQEVFERAAEDWTQERVQSLITAYEQEAEKFKQEAKDKHQELMAEVFKKRWIREGKDWLGRPRKEVAKRIVEGDYKTLMDEDQGPEEIMRQILTGKNNPMVDPPRPYTTEEIEDLLKDKDFIEKVQPELVKQLLAKRLMIGSIPAGDVVYISGTEWGKDMIRQAFEENKATKKLIDDLESKGVARLGLFERIRRRFAEKPILLALLLLLPLGAAGCLDWLKEEAGLQEESVGVPIG